MFSCTGLSPSTATPSRGLPLTSGLSHSFARRQTCTAGPTTPLPQPLPGITWKRFSLIRFRSPLLTESRLFSLPVGTEMFHFPTFPPHALCVQARVTPHDWCGVPPFGHPRINARLAAPRGLSQPPTSFIGSWCPGIHRVPSTSWPHHYLHTLDTHTSPRRPHPQVRTPRTRAGPEIKDARVHCAVLNDQPATLHNPTPPAPTRSRRTVERSEIQKGLEHPGAQPPERGSSPLPQDPTACLRPTRLPPAPVPRTGARRRDAVLEGRRSGRPNWSAFHPRAPPRTHGPAPLLGTGSRSGRGSAPTDTPEGRSAGQCSLERR